MTNMKGTAAYCIVGTGFAGTCALWHVVRRLTDPRHPPSPPPSAVTIVTVEAGWVSGPGYPYGHENVQLAHRCNNEASTMGIHGNDFVDWLAESKPWLTRDHPELLLETHPGTDLGEWQPVGGEFYPRALFGMYLERRFQEAVERARAHGIDVRQYVRHEAIDGSTTERGFALSLRDLDTGREFGVDGLDRVLLSTGHWESTAVGALSGGSGYVASPYPPDEVEAAVAERLRSRPSRGEPPCVFVQGMGPSGIDAIMTLCGAGEFVYTRDGHVASYRPPARSGTHDGEAPLRIVAGSRCGFFSPVRGPLAPYEPHHLTEEHLAAIRREHRGRLKLESVLELVDKDLCRATDGAMGWDDIKSPRYRSAEEKLASDLRESYTGNLVYTIALKARRMRFYNQLDAADKATYDRLLDTHFIRTAVPMPAANAEKLLALMAAGVLTTVRQGYDAPRTAVGEDGGFLVAYETGDGRHATLRADCVIRASGQDFSMENHPSPLVQNLLKRGEIVPHEEGGYVTGGIALDASGGYRVLKRVGGACVPSPHLSSYGAPVRFWQHEHNFAGAFVEAAERVADDWFHAAAATARSAARVPGSVSTEKGS